MLSQSSLRTGAALLVLVAASSCGFKHKKFENPITKQTDQPDKILFDRAIKDIEKGRYEIARIDLNVLLNTYESSEFAAKAKLAMADAWYQEGGMRGFAQAEAEYNDFILFYPQMEEAAEAQKRNCEIHYKQMEKADRDPNEALRAEQTCRQLLTRFPNSVFVAEAEQMLRNIQEVIADGEFRVGDFYRSRGNPNAAANRLGGLADQYPNFSKADEALWLEGESLRLLGPAFRGQEADSYVRIVRDYPLSKRVDEAKARLTAMEVRIPDPDPAALARMQLNIDSRVPPGMLGRTFGFMRRGPDTWTAAKNGAPQMNAPKQNIPPLTPAPGGGVAGFQGDVTVTPLPTPQPAAPKPAPPKR